MLKQIIKTNPLLHRAYYYIVNWLVGKNKYKLSRQCLKIYDCVIKRSTFHDRGFANRIIIHKGSYLEGCNIQIFGSNNQILIGENVILHGVTLHIEDDNNNIVIQNNVTIEEKTKLSCIEGKKLYIGEDCMLSSEVIISTGDSHSIINEEGMRINSSKDVVIGSHVWIGNRVSINKGVVIAANSVIGNGSIVTKGLTEENCVLAGNPAKIVKTNINWRRERL